MSDPTQRFSTRVANYVKYRPSYPSAVVDLLRQECGLTAQSRIADVGSGTGLLAELFLQNGNPVWGVEPNADMRQAGERLLAAYPGFTSVKGTAEHTGLDAGSVEFVTAGQAFHWFDRGRARVEFERILAPSGWCVLVWNDRRLGSTPFLRDYEALLHTYGTDYSEVNHTNMTPDVIEEFFGHGMWREQAFVNVQVLDYTGLEGRLLSSSYTPEPGDLRYAPMLTDLRAIFDRDAEGGSVAMEYDTRVFYGRLKG